MDLIATGHIRGAFGLEGFVKVESLSGEYGHFLNLERIFIRIPEFKFKKKQIPDGWFDVEDVKIRHSDALFKLKKIDTVEDAKSLTGSTVFVLRDMAAPIESGEFYIHDICNCVLVYEGNLVGKIASVVEGGGGYLLEVFEAASERVVYVPFNKEFIGTVDLENRTVELMHRWILE